MRSLLPVMTSFPSLVSGVFLAPIIARIQQSDEITASRLKQLEDKIMAILDEKLAEISGKLSGVQAGLVAVTEAIAAEAAQFQDLKDSLGGLTPEQQAALDSISNNLTGVADQLSGISGGISGIVVE